LEWLIGSDRNQRSDGPGMRMLVDGANGIIAGHGRVLAARKLGIKPVPVIELAHLTESQKRAYVLADNRLAEQAGWVHQPARPPPVRQQVSYARNGRARKAPPSAITPTRRGARKRVLGLAASFEAVIAPGRDLCRTRGATGRYRNR
jgi:hypothetical protein